MKLLSKVLLGSLLLATFLTTGCSGSVEVSPDYVGAAMPSFTFGIISGTVITLLCLFMVCLKCRQL